MCSKICCVIPCYNVETYCGKIVRQAAEYADWLVAVDDGSTDSTKAELMETARLVGRRIRVLSMPTNQGKGVAIMEGFRYALEQFPFDVLVTLDADGQHCPSDIPRIVGACSEKGISLTIGERSPERSLMPLRSRIGNIVTSYLIRRLYPSSPADTQSGFRAIRPGFVREILETIKGRRYETEMLILLHALGKQERIATIPIRTIYLDGNKTSHFHPLMDSLRIYRALIASVIRPRRGGRGMQPAGSMGVPGLDRHLL